MSDGKRLPAKRVKFSSIKDGWDYFVFSDTDFKNRFAEIRNLSSRQNAKGMTREDLENKLAEDYLLNESDILRMHQAKALHHAVAAPESSVYLLKNPLTGVYYIELDANSIREDAHLAVEEYFQANEALIAEQIYGGAIPPNTRSAKAKSDSVKLMLSIRKARLKGMKWAEIHQLLSTGELPGYNSKKHFVDQFVLKDTYNTFIKKLNS